MKILFQTHRAVQQRTTLCCKWVCEETKTYVKKSQQQKINGICLNEQWICPVKSACQGELPETLKEIIKQRKETVNEL